MNEPVPTVPGHSEVLTHVCETCGLVVGDDSKHSHGPDDDQDPPSLQELLRP